MMDLNFAQAYAKGYYDGRTQGVELNPFNSVREREEFHGYRWGYDKGVADYCEEVHPEKIEVIS